MTTKKDAWIAAYCAGLQIWMPDFKIYSEKPLDGSLALAKKAAADFEAAFPEMPESEQDGDFIKIPRVDANGFELPEWVKPGVECIFEGHIRMIDFIGIDEAKLWCCRLVSDGNHTKAQWALIKNIKPKNG